MARTSLAERQARLAQQRARLQLEENRLKDAERKARTRQLIEAGGLIEKAGLMALEPNALLGALLSLQAGAADADQVKAWARIGGHAARRDARAQEAAKEPLILTLAAAQPTGVTARLRKAGFRWSKVLQHWEGLALYEEAQDLARELGGELRRVEGQPATQPAPPPGGAAASSVRAAE